jgi:hypothetical protein
MGTRSLVVPANPDSFPPHLVIADLSDLFIFYVTSDVHPITFFAKDALRARRLKSGFEVVDHS